MVAGVEAAVEDLNTVKRGEGEDIVELKASVGILLIPVSSDTSLRFKLRLSLIAFRRSPSAEKSFIGIPLKE